MATQNIGDKPVYIEPATAAEKIASLAAMAALIEEHADMWGGADRLTQLIDCCTDARTWNALSNMIALDMLDGVS